MQLSLRIILIAVSLLTLAFMIRKIRKSKLQIEYAIFWIGFSFVLFFISLFPQIPIWLAKLCGIESPANFIFLFVIFILLIHEFNLTVKLSNAENRLTRLVQELAIRNKKEN